MKRSRRTVAGADGLGAGKAKNMAIKINLLPQSYALEKTRNRWIAGMAALLGLTGLSIGLLYASDKKQLEKVNTDVATVTAVAQLTTQAQTAKTTADTASSSIKNVVDFMADASKSGSERAAFLDLMRRYIFRNVVISDIDVSNGADAKITATVRTPDEYARFLLALRQGATGSSGGGNAVGAGKVFDNLPVASGVRGFPEGRILPQAPELSDSPTPITFPIRVDAQGKLKTDPSPRNGLLYLPPEPSGTVASAVTQGAGGASGGGGSSGSGGSYPGSSGSSGSSSSYPGSSGR